LVLTLFEKYTKSWRAYHTRFGGSCNPPVLLC